MSIYSTVPVATRPADSFAVTVFEIGGWAPGTPEKPVKIAFENKARSGLRILNLSTGNSACYVEPDAGIGKTGWQIPLGGTLELNVTCEVWCHVPASSSTVNDTTVIVMELLNNDLL